MSQNCRACAVRLPHNECMTYDHVSCRFHVSWCKDHLHLLLMLSRVCTYISAATRAAYMWSTHRKRILFCTSSIMPLSECCWARSVSGMFAEAWVDGLNAILRMRVTSLMRSSANGLHRTVAERDVGPMQCRWLVYSSDQVC